LATNYWIFKVTDEVGGLYGRRGFSIFEHRAKECFWGLREQDSKGKSQPYLDALKKDDAVIFYLVGKGGSRFVGTAILDSDYQQLPDELREKVIHSEYLDYGKGVFLKGVKKWDKPLPIEGLSGKESVVASGVKLTAYFQGSIKKIKKKEYELIFREHEFVI